MKNTLQKNLICAAVLAAGLATPLAVADDTPNRGVSQVNDGSFNYQGFLEFNGTPANGDFFFEVHLLDSNGDEIDPRFDQPGPITVTDGLFDMDIQMGGTQADAEYFWKEYGHLAKKMRIMVGTVEGGPYTTLSPDVDLSTSPHALWSRYAGALQFPYTDTYSNDFGDSTTMMSLHNEFGGTVLEVSSGLNTNYPTLYVAGNNLFDTSTLIDQGMIQANDLDRPFGVVSIANQFPIVGLIQSDSSANHAAVLGEVFEGSNPNTIAIWALNDVSGNDAALGGGTYAGDFTGDVLARNDLRVQGEPSRDYAFNSPSPIGPLAYGSISVSGNVYSGTANLSSSWDAANSRYVISVSGENITFQTHTISISVVELSGPRLATYVTNSGDVWVKIWDIAAGNIAIQDNFSIVIYDPTATTLNRIATPNGMDEDKYTEKTGIQLIHTEPRNEPVEPFENYGSGVIDQ